MFKNRRMISTMWYTHSVKYYSAVKTHRWHTKYHLCISKPLVVLKKANRKENIPLITTSMNLKNGSKSNHGNRTQKGITLEFGRWWCRIDWKKSPKELSEIRKRFYILIGGLVTWAYSFIKLIKVCILNGYSFAYVNYTLIKMQIMLQNIGTRKYCHISYST